MRGRGKSANVALGASGHCMALFHSPLVRSYVHVAIHISWCQIMFRADLTQRHEHIASDDQRSSQGVHSIVGLERDEMQELRGSIGCRLDLKKGLQFPFFRPSLVRLESRDCHICDSHHCLEKLTCFSRPVLWLNLQSCWLTSLERGILPYK